MMKTISLHETRTGVYSQNDGDKFNERFPDELITVRPIAKAPSFSNLSLNSRPEYQNDLQLPEDDDIETKRIRRHTWTLGLASSELETNKAFLDVSGLDLPRRRSSAVSVVSTHDVIEECPSDEEGEKEEESNSAPFDYMKCKNCSGENKANRNHHLDSMNYCFNCKHLHQDKSLSCILSAFNPTRRSSWSPGDSDRTEILRRNSASRRGSADLPAISEPISDEATSSVDDKEESKLQQRVKNEVERLIRFNSRRDTISCELECKKLGLLRRFKFKFP